MPLLAEDPVDFAAGAGELLLLHAATARIVVAARPNRALPLILP
jgi:hypothetical protein